MPVYRTAKVELRVDVTCEACGHKYMMQHEISHTTDAFAFSGLSTKDPTEGLMKKIERLEVGVLPCPECKYLQSWMIPVWRRCILGKTLLGSILLGIAAAIFRSASHILLLCIPGVIALGVFCGIRPNRRWHREHGPRVPEPRQPTIRPIPHQHA